MVNIKTQYENKMFGIIAPSLSIKGFDNSWDVFVFGSSSEKEESEEDLSVDDRDLDWFLDLPVPYIPELDPSIKHC